MATELLVSPDAETQNPAPEVVEDTPTTTEADANPDAEGEAKADDPAKTIERMQRRIDKKHAAAAAARAEAALLRQQLEQLQGKPKDEPTEDVEKRAELIAERRVFDAAADAIVSKGKAKEKDFLPALEDLATEVGPFVQANGLPSKFMRAVLDVSETPHELLYYLGKNPDLAADLADLPVTKLAAKLDRIERELKDKATPKSSSAPKPLEPVKTKPSSSLLPQDNDSVDDWLKKERARLSAKKG